MYSLKYIGSVGNGAKEKKYAICIVYRGNKKSKITDQLHWLVQLKENKPIGILSDLRKSLIV